MMTNCMRVHGRYGIKIRFPHALVMTFLFHEGRYDIYIYIYAISEQPFISYFGL